MPLEDALAALAARREAFKTFREEVDAELRAERARRLKAEADAIERLVVEAAAQDATIGQLKRAYDTKDHRTISDMLKRNGPEIDAIRRGATNAVREQPDWFTVTEDGHIIVDYGNRGEATYSYTEMEDGKFLFHTNEPLWDPTFTVKNEAVEVLDGKTESDSAEARVVAKFIREH